MDRRIKAGRYKQDAAVHHQATIKASWLVDGGYMHSKIQSSECTLMSHLHHVENTVPATWPVTSSNSLTAFSSDSPTFISSTFYTWKQTNSASSQQGVDWSFTCLSATQKTSLQLISAAFRTNSDTSAHFNRHTSNDTSGDFSVSSSALMQNCKK